METRDLVVISEPRCKICTDPQRGKIEAALALPGMSMRQVARDFGMSPMAIQRHRPHMSMIIEAARAVKEIESLGTLYTRIKRKGERLWELMEKAAEGGDFRAASALAAEARKHDEILAKFGEKPGFRNSESQGPPINAPHAQILITRDGGG